MVGNCFYLGDYDGSGYEIFWHHSRSVMQKVAAVQDVAGQWHWGLVKNLEDGDAFKILLGLTDGDVEKICWHLDRLPTLPEVWAILDDLAEHRQAYAMTTDPPTESAQPQERDSE